MSYETRSQYLSCLTKKNAQQKSQRVYNFPIMSCTYRYEPLSFPKLHTFLLNMLEQFSPLLCMKEINIEHKSYSPHPTDVIEY